jgi:hypothetical protein
MSLERVSASVVAVASPPALSDTSMEAKRLRVCT